MKQQELFEESGERGPQGLAAPEYAADVFLSRTDCDLPPNWAGLFELSADAFYAAIHAEMSELPIKNEISRFIDKVRKAGEKISGGKFEKDRAAASKAAFDRGDPDVLAVLKAAGRVQHEIYRITGLLRFSPGACGTYTARCSPDFFILPALAEHFTLRFGETPWAIIDEKRKLCLSRGKSGKVTLDRIDSKSAASCQVSAAHGEAGSSLPNCANGEKDGKDSWEELWRLYHRSVNNEGKKNLRLQRQFMPVRYHKYLPEMK
jgi:probable DNA metabolism protein